MRRFWKEVGVGLGFAVLGIALLFPYLQLSGVWWRAMPSTLVVLGVARLLYGYDARRFLGLRMTCVDLGRALLLFLVSLPIVYLTLFSTNATSHLTVELQHGVLPRVHQFFQVLNDEMVMRGALLTVCLRYFRRQRVVVYVMAAAFAFGHQAIYWVNGVTFSAAVFVTLFCFGAILNLLFVACRHIGYGVALHYGWNFFRFSGTQYVLDGVPLSEGETFNAVEGNAWFACASVVALVLVAVVHAYRSPRSAS